MKTKITGKPAPKGRADLKRKATRHNPPSSSDEGDIQRTPTPRRKRLAKPRAPTPDPPASNPSDQDGDTTSSIHHQPSSATSPPRVAPVPADTAAPEPITVSSDHDHEAGADASKAGPSAPAVPSSAAAGLDISRRKPISALLVRESKQEGKQQRRRPARHPSEAPTVEPRQRTHGLTTQELQAAGFALLEDDGVEFTRGFEAGGWLKESYTLPLESSGGIWDAPINEAEPQPSSFYNELRAQQEQRLRSGKDSRWPLGKAGSERVNVAEVMLRTAIPHPLPEGKTASMHPHSGAPDPSITSSTSSSRYATMKSKAFNYWGSVGRAGMLVDWTVNGSKLSLNIYVNDICSLTFPRHYRQIIKPLLNWAIDSSKASSALGLRASTGLQTNDEEAELRLELLRKLEDEREFLESLGDSEPVRARIASLTDEIEKRKAQ